MLPFIQGEILSEVTRFDPYEFLEEDFEGAGMAGHLACEFVAEAAGTKLIQRETLYARGFLRVVEPMIRFTLSRALRKRLEEIKMILESGWSGN